MGQRVLSTCWCCLKYRSFSWFARGPRGGERECRSLIRRGDGAVLHVSLLAVGPVGWHPVVPGRFSPSLTDRRSLALSPIASWHVLGRRSSLRSSWRSSRERGWRWTDSHPGCVASLTANDEGMVVQ